MNALGQGSEKGQAPKQERSRATRAQLIAAAREIFARDGYEMARLEEIAAAAGKTRGAFYAHFEDKEELFFAIFEDDLHQDDQRLEEALRGVATLAERLEALTELLCALAKDRRRMLLVLEFKLFAIRHPEMGKRLAHLHGAALWLRCAEARMKVLLPELGRGEPAETRGQTAQIGAVIDGVALNRMFDPEAMNEGQLRAVVRAGVELVMAE